VQTTAQLSFMQPLNRSPARPSKTHLLHIAPVRRYR
jgi:hypothetical protein